MRRHHGKQSVLVGDTKRLQRRDRRRRQRKIAPEHGQHRNRGSVCDPQQHDCGKRNRKGAQMAAKIGAIRRRWCIEDGWRTLLWGQHCALFFVERHCGRGWLPACGDKAQQQPVIQQQKSQSEDQIIEECVVGGQDHADLPRRDDTEAYNPPAARQKEHPHQTKLHHQRADHSGRLKPVRQMLHIPADPGGQRAVLIVLIHCGQVAPLGIPARQLDYARFKVNAEPLPQQQPQRKARRGRRLPSG